MAFQTASGASLSVSASQPATYDSTGFAALTYTVVGEITNIGEFGKEFATVTHNPLATRGTKKGKGSYNNGTLSPALALDPDDAGQDIMETLLDSDNPGSFLVTLQDGTKYYLEGLVMSFKPSVGDIDSVVTASTSVEVTDNDIVKVAAA
ncbi:hypothetical protein [Pseudodonghicola flavimaris]|uniref:Phage tail protein n=1 Tax=Pseudodonghicola flavimaris TaxID=3050036 RepID=A0ABT7EW93_9RHOB|nr:hypothetical protein [Pseudodonghicola flavimaris]MDK3016550.1 hypothetical protein [Pseudodonghicola flavimaris]